MQIMQQEMQNNAQSHQQKMEQMQTKFALDMQKSTSDSKQEIGKMLTDFGVQLQLIQAQLNAGHATRAGEIHSAAVQSALDAVTSQHENDLRVQSANAADGAGA